MINNYINNQTLEILNTEKLALLKDNAMLKVNPKTWIYWNFEKNKNIDIYSVTKSPKYKLWWYCEVCESSYEQLVNHKVNNVGCPVCDGKIVNNYNCMATTNPLLASKLLNYQDSFKYTQKSDVKLDWKCKNCDTVIYNKTINSVNANGLNCKLCSDGKSYPEKLMSNILSQLNIDYVNDKSMNFIKDRRYDFYLSEYNMIIEMHGKQHYEVSTGYYNESKVKEIIKIDNLKKETALLNGINKYIVIDSRFSNLEWIKTEILNSELSKILNLSTIDWDKADLNSSNSKKVECLNLYNSGNRDYEEMAKMLNVAYGTVIRWLNSWKAIGKCDYEKLDNKKKIIQLDKNKELVKIWNSVSEVRVIYKNVSKVLNKERSNVGGFIFMYENDYEKFLENKGNYKFTTNKSISKKVIQLTKQGEFIKRWNSMIEASKAVGSNNASGISSVCLGRKKTSKGYMWMYEEDYLNS